MSTEEKTELFKLIDKYTQEYQAYCDVASDLEKLIIEYAEYRHLKIDYVEVY